jgi:hypothetical protein
VSTTILVVFVVIAILIFGDEVLHTPSSVIAVFLFGFMVNAIGDYLALLKTRLLLRRYKAGMSIIPIVLIDAVGVVSVYFSMVVLAVTLNYGLQYLTGSSDVPSFNAWVHSVGKVITEIAHQPLVDFAGRAPQSVPYKLPDKIMLYSTFLTMLMTSLWLWIALIFSPIIRLLVWSQVTGLTFVGMMFDVHRAPFAAMGYLCAFLILTVGGIVSAGQGLAGMNLH